MDKQDKKSTIRECYLSPAPPTPKKNKQKTYTTLIGLITNPIYLFCIINFLIFSIITMTNEESLIELSVNSTTSYPKFDRRRQWNLQLTKCLEAELTFTKVNTFYSQQRSQIICVILHLVIRLVTSIIL